MKYSILIPAFKIQYLRECLESLFNQTNQDFEVIVLNDCSPDDIASVVADFHDSRLRYYENDQNIGVVDVVDNWNKLLSLALGGFVVCMGDDDKLAPNFHEQYDKLMVSYPGLDLYHARTEIIDEHSDFLNLQEDRPSWQSAYQMLWNCIFEPTIQFIGDFLFRRTTLLSNGGFYKLPLAWGADCLSAIIAAKEKGCANTHEPTFFYRSNRYSITQSSNIELKMVATKQFADWVRNFVVDVPAEDVDAIYRRLLKQGLSSSIHHDMRLMMADDMRNHMTHLVRWVRTRYQYELSLSDVALAAAIAVGLKLLRK